MCFENFWNHSHTLHVMKNLFKIDYAENFFVFSKILSFNQSNVFFDQSKILCFQNMTFYQARLLFDWLSINQIWFLKLLINWKFPKFLGLGFASLDWYSIYSKPIKAGKFLDFKFLINLFHASSMFRIHMHCIVFCFNFAFL